MTNAEDDFLTPPPLVHERAFARMCEVLELEDGPDKQLIRIAIASYERQKSELGDWRN